MLKTFKNNIPKWQNFAKSGNADYAIRIVLEVDIISMQMKQLQRSKFSPRFAENIAGRQAGAITSNNFGLNFHFGARPQCT